jgi:glycosyltransferase involved in cell wall biosynthesis
MMTDDGRNTEPRPPAASVVTTVFNRARTLERAMRSVLEQSFDDFEYIVVDDGSTDDSVRIAESFPDPRIRVERMPHRGRAAALNSAFSLCRGEFILIQDSDDVALPGRFEKQIGFLRSRPDVGMVGCQCRLVDAASGHSRPLRLPVEHEQLLPLMMLTSAVVFGASAMRRDTASSAGPFDEALSAAEDYDFQLRMLWLSRFHNIDSELEEIHICADSQSVVRRDEQNRVTMECALSMLEKEKRTPVLFDNPLHARRSEALVHYYYGEIALARKQLLALLRGNPFSLTFWRYLLPSLLGTRMLGLLRESGVSRRLSSPLRLFRFSRKHFLP